VGIGSGDGIAAHRPGRGRRALHQQQRIQMMQKTAARQQVRARHPQFAGGTAAQHKTPPAFGGIVEMLHRVEDRRHVLRLV
jgi:hypothetical protein